MLCCKPHVPPWLCLFGIGFNSFFYSFQWLTAIQRAWRPEPDGCHAGGRTVSRCGSSGPGACCQGDHQIGFPLPCTALSICHDACCQLCSFFWSNSKGSSGRSGAVQEEVSQLMLGKKGIGVGIALLAFLPHRLSSAEQCCCHHLCFSLAQLWGHPKHSIGHSHPSDAKPKY